MGELSDRMIAELVDAVRAQLRKEAADRLRDIYLIGDIEKDTARTCIERLREFANENDRPITVFINSAGGNVTDGLAIHDAIRQIIKDTKRTDFYLDATNALEYGLIDAVIAGELPEPKPQLVEPRDTPHVIDAPASPAAEAAMERPSGSRGSGGGPPGQP